MRFTVKEPKTTLLDVDVELPFYRMHDVSDDGYSSVIYTKVFARDGEMMSVSVTMREDYRSDTRSVEVEVKPFRPLGDTANYVLGRGIYACTREEFDAAAREAARMLDGALTQPEG